MTPCSNRWADKVDAHLALRVGRAAHDSRERRRFRTTPCRTRGPAAPGTVASGWPAARSSGRLSAAGFGASAWRLWYAGGGALVAVAVAVGAGGTGVFVAVGTAAPAWPSPRSRWASACRRRHRLGGRHRRAERDARQQRRVTSSAEHQNQRNPTPEAHHSHACTSCSAAPRGGAIRRPTLPTRLRPSQPAREPDQSPMLTCPSRRRPERRRCRPACKSSSRECGRTGRRARP